MDKARNAPRDAARRAPRVVVRASQQTMRDHNLGLVMAAIRDAVEAPSRADIAASTGLTRATISTLVEYLLAARFVREMPAVPGERAGRPRVPLVAAPGTRVALGMEINVDYLGLQAIDLAGTVVAQEVVAGDFRASEPEAVIARLVDLAQTVGEDLARDGVSVCGSSLGLPGLVDDATGPLRVAPNLGWRDLDVLAVARAAGAVPGGDPQLANEAKLAAIAEARARRQAGPGSFVFVSGEVGVGAGIVLDGRLYRGAHGWSGEIGHVLVDGARTLESVAGADAMLDAAGFPRTSAVASLLGAGPAADRALGAAADALGVALTAVVNIADVEHVVLGGVYANVADRIAPLIADRIRSGAVAAPWLDVTVDVAVAGPYAAMRGGALAVLDDVAANPAVWL